MFSISSGHHLNRNLFHQKKGSIYNDTILQTMATVFEDQSIPFSIFRSLTAYTPNTQASYIRPQQTQNENHLPQKRRQDQPQGRLASLLGRCPAVRCPYPITLPCSKLTIAILPQIRWPRDKPLANPLHHRPRAAHPPRPGRGPYPAELCDYSWKAQAWN